MLQVQDERKKLKLFYRDQKLEEVELDGHHLEGGLNSLLHSLRSTGSIEVPSIQELREMYDLEYVERR